MLATNPNSWVLLCFLAFIVSILIRVINSAFRAADKTYKKSFCHIFIGADDQWLSTIIGGLEIIAYSLFIKADVAVYIGAWLAFKTANRWNYTPKVGRGLFNRYLLSNGLVLVAAYIFAKVLYA